MGLLVTVEHTCPDLIQSLWEIYYEKGRWMFVLKEKHREFQIAYCPFCGEDLPVIGVEEIIKLQDK